MKGTACFVAFLLAGASPTRAADLRLPDKCKVPELLFEQARHDLAKTCKERIDKVEAERGSQGTVTKALTAVSIVSGILATGGAAALTGIPSIGPAIQAADPSAQPSDDVAGWQLGVGIATGIFSASAAAFATLAVFWAPQSEEAGALHVQLNSARAAANNLALVPVFALDDQESAKKILGDAAAKCALSNLKPRDGDDVKLATRDLMSRVSAIATAAGAAPPQQPQCLRSLEHDRTNRLWVAKNAAGAFVLLNYTVDRTSGSVDEICSLDNSLTKKDCTKEPFAIRRFLEEFSDANP